MQRRQSLEKYSLPLANASLTYQNFTRSLGILLLLSVSTFVMRPQSAQAAPVMQTATSEGHAVVFNLKLWRVNVRLQVPNVALRIT
ncbi:MAG: hypothetical protein H7240_05365 [Glaciimonas sp.]|nr:hypothetical protein [Glaciimonas sp.]